MSERVHVVCQGEHLRRIAHRYGVRPEEIWEHPKNASLRGLRGTGDILLSGDELIIPMRESPRSLVQIGASNRYVSDAHSVVNVQVRLEDHRGPMTDVAFRLESGGQPREGRSDGEGKVRLEIPVGLSLVRLILPERNETLLLQVGSIDPIESDSGVRQRLQNLGYFVRSTDGDSTHHAYWFHRAIRQFQHDQRIRVTGELDAATRSRLREIHGC